MYLVNRLRGDNYICDRCQDCENPKQIISFKEYYTNKRNGNHYCKECWSYINLQKGKCQCGSQYTGRSKYGKLHISCNCGETLWLK